MKLVWLTGLMTLSMKSALGLRCYTCNSHFDPLCGDPFFDDIGEVRSGDRYEQECLPEFGQAVFCRKGVGSGDAVERGCGWEEEMREELRRDWWEGWGSGWLDTSGCYTHRTMGRMCACYSDNCNKGVLKAAAEHLLTVALLTVMGLK